MNNLFTEGDRVKLISVNGLRNKNLKSLIGATGTVCWAHSDQQINVQFEDSYRSRFSVQAKHLEKIITQQLQPGDIAKNKNWNWGGKITQITGETVHILVGNAETGETITCPLAECVKKNLQTGEFEPASGSNDQTNRSRT